MPTYAEELVAEITGILMMLSTDMGVLMHLVDNAKAIGARIDSLKTHQFELEQSAGLLSVGIPDKYREVYQRYKLVSDKLENFRDAL